MNRWLLPILAAGILLYAGQAFAAGATFVGSETCSGCHETVSQSHGDSIHAQAWASIGGKFSESGCESCHGPGSVHADTNDKADIVSFGKGSAQDAATQSAQCLNCHITSTELAFWDVSQHNGETSCADCHNTHASVAPKVAQPDTCFECHKDVRRDSNKRSHHPIIEGKVSCGDCHNPHGSMEHGMLRADSRNQLCYTCHAEKRGPFIWEHPPVEENCGVCHESHGSRHAKLLTERTPNLCQNCHDWAYHPGTPYDNNNGFDATGPSFDDKFVGRSCLNCHNNVHGSNSPDSKMFVR